MQVKFKVVCALIKGLVLLTLFINDISTMLFQNQEQKLGVTEQKLGVIMHIFLPEKLEIAQNLPLFSIQTTVPDAGKL